MRAELICRSASTGLVSLQLPDRVECVLGAAGGGADLELPSQGIERRHALVRREQGGFRIEALAGAVGLNGRPVISERLASLDVIRLGDERLVFIAREAAGPEKRRGVTSAWLERQPGGERIEWPASESILGRSAEARIRISDASVSKAHARLIRTLDALEVVDLGSANGTRVDGVLVASSPLAAGSLLEVAGVALRVGVEWGEVVFEPHTSSRPEPVSVDSDEDLRQRVASLSDDELHQSSAATTAMAPVRLPPPDQES